MGGDGMIKPHKWRRGVNSRKRKKDTEEMTRGTWAIIDLLEMVIPNKSTAHEFDDRPGPHLRRKEDTA